MNLEDKISDPIERKYFQGLLTKVNDKSEQLVIHTDENPTGVYPTAIAPSNLMDSFPHFSYEEVRSKYKPEGKLDASLWLRKMNGGLGSSIKRDKYLKKQGRDSIGAKGTDLLVKTDDGEISIAEAQIVQAMKKANSFNTVIFQDIVNEDVKDLFESIWDKGYKEKFSTESLKRFPPVIQSKVPTLDSNGELTTERTAPAGHGIFGFEVIASIFDQERLPNEKNLICCIGNGEDLSSTPDRAIVNWMLQEEVPICMVTTTKTVIDMKGGQIALWDKGSEGCFLTIVEKAQAETADQLELFSNIGLRDGDKEAFFNTNLALVNIDALKKLFADKNEDEILEAALPDLIKNNKEQNGKTYTQLEGAMGSVFLNLDTYWRKKYKKPIVHILNVSKKHRTRFFSPIKSAFDYFLQFHSDRFTFNNETYHLENNRPGNLPLISLPKHYSTVTNVLEDFDGAKTINLEKIEIVEPRSFVGLELSGNVT